MDTHLSSSSGKSNSFQYKTQLKKFLRDFFFTVNFMLFTSRLFNITLEHALKQMCLDFVVTCTHILNGTAQH